MTVRLSNRPTFSAVMPVDANPPFIIYKLKSRHGQGTIYKMSISIKSKLFYLKKKN